LKVAKATGAQFQSLFEQIMEKHDASFCRIKPGGPEGDWKSDGYSTANGTIYQCHAPEVVRSDIRDLELFARERLFRVDCEAREFGPLPILEPRIAEARLVEMTLRKGVAGVEVDGEQVRVGADSANFFVMV
jgi:hypothetical protein